MAGCRQGAVPRLFGCSWEPHNKSGFVHTHVGFVQRWRLGGASQSSDATPLLVSKIVGSSRSGSVTHRNFVVMAAAAAAESNQDNLPAVSNVVTVRHADLLNKSSDLAAVLEEGFGPSGLGIIAISGVPKFSELRKKLLKLSQSLSALPEEAKLQLEDPISKYSFGWSYGKEILDSGQPDSLKGSFYANPLYDVPTLDAKLIQRYPAHCRPNLWPTKHLPELEPTFKMLGALMVEVGLLIANHCDKYISSKNPSFKEGILERMLSSSYTHKGRLLHYFPNISSTSCEGQDQLKSWCGWHTDHSSLTALTCAMYIKGGVEIPCPDPEAGLYVRKQSGAIVKALYNVDSIAYQMGEATEILSDGLFHATPHFVKAALGSIGSEVERNTFAIFMQPHWDEPLKFSTNSEVGDHKSQKTLTFGEFSERTISKYY